MMKHILLTGFDPFGGETVNPAWEAVSRLNDRIGDYRIDRLMVPTVFGKAGETVLRACEKASFDVVICVGQAGGRSGVTPEMVAINLRHAGICDNAGAAPQDEPVVNGGPAAYFSTLPVRRMVRRMAEEGIASSVSYSAGTFVCNDLMYTVLNHFAETNVRAGFIHVPFLPEQAKNGAPSMPLSEITRALTLSILSLQDAQA